MKQLRIENSSSPGRNDFGGCVEGVCGGGWMEEMNEK